MNNSRVYLFLIAVVLGVLAVWLSAERLILIGIMDDSLTSDVELTRKVAQGEVIAARILLAVMAMAMLGAALFWPQIARSAIYQRNKEVHVPIPPSYEVYLRRVLTPAAGILSGAIVVMLLYIQFGDTLFTPEQLGQINREDGLLETASAAMLLVAAVLSALIAYRIGRGHPRFWAHLGLGFLFFLMCGEEISWGQRIIGLETPEALQGINVQNEINLHNNFGYVADHLFIFCFLVWAALVPLAYHSVPPLRQVILRLGIPVPSAGLAIAMVIVGIMLDPVVYRLVTPLESLRLAEARETLAALAFLLLTWEVKQHFHAFGAAPRPSRTAT
jgi:hypothetical protein